MYSDRQSTLPFHEQSSIIRAQQQQQQQEIATRMMMTNVGCHTYTMTTSMSPYTSTPITSNQQEQPQHLFDPIVQCSDLLFHLLQFCTAEELSHSCSLVCRNWYQLINGNSQPLWKFALYQSLVRYYRSMTNGLLAALLHDDVEQHNVLATIHRVLIARFEQSLNRKNRSSVSSNDTHHCINWRQQYYRFKQLTHAQHFWSKFHKRFSPNSRSTNNNNASAERHRIPRGCFWIQPMIQHAPSLEDEHSVWTDMLRCIIKVDSVNHRYLMYHQDSNKLILVAKLLPYGSTQQEQSSVPFNNNNNVTNVAPPPSSLFSGKRYGIYKVTGKGATQQQSQQQHQQQRTLSQHEMKESMIRSTQHQSIETPFDTVLIAHLQSSRLGLQFDLSDYDMVDPSSLNIRYRMNLFGFGGYNKIDVQVPRQKFMVKKWWNMKAMIDEVSSIILSDNSAPKQQQQQQQQVDAMKKKKECADIHNHLLLHQVEVVMEQDEIMEHFGSLFGRVCNYPSVELKRVNSSDTSQDNMHEERKSSEFNNNNNNNSDNDENSSDDVLSLEPYTAFTNRSPTWSPKQKSWSLDFGGRVHVRSVKNFQLVERSNDPAQKKRNHLLMGKMDNDTFAIDFRYPFNALQAFCVALSALDHKIACP